MKELNALHQFEMPKVGIYFLFKNDELVYIGQTQVGLDRICSHIRSKEFDSYSFYKCKKHQLNELEKEFIIRYKPKLNKTFVKQQVEIRENFITKWKTNLEKFKKENEELLT